MMNNLFSMFDPSSSIFSMVWLMLLLIMSMMSVTVWKQSSSTKKVMKKVITTFKNEVKFTLGSPAKSTEIMIIMVFISILLMNVTALYPQIFSTTAHLTVTLPLSLTMWMTIFIFGWIKNTNHMLSHLLPQGTPTALTMFMVMIEGVSNLIRPITLCVRLTANLIAGHLLMSLLGNMMISLDATSLIMMSMTPLLLTILESAVACIQAYVFMTLITLYTTEIN